MEQQPHLGYKYDFEIFIESIKIEYKLPFNFKILFKRGNKQNELDKTFKYDPTSSNDLILNESFTISCIMKPEDSTKKINFSKPNFSEKKI